MKLLISNCETFRLFLSQEGLSDGVFSILLLLNFFAQLARVFNCTQGLLQEVKVRLVHDEDAISRLANQLVIFTDPAHLLVVLPRFRRRFHLGQHFQLTFQLSLLQLVQTLLIILIAQIVDGHLPPLQQVSSLLAYALAHLRPIASINLQGSCDFTLLQVFHFDRQLLQNF